MTRSAIVVGIVLLGAGVRGHAATYLFSTFKGDALSQESLSTYSSADALNFKLVSDTGFSGPSGALRDPSIMKYADGKYYVAYTDPLGAGCCGKEDHFSIADSTDLVHWTTLTTVSGGVPGLAHVWAPEWFVEGSTVMIIANIDTRNTDSDFKPYIFTALNTSLTSWSGPVAMGIGPNYIDTFALKVGSTYHVFTKDETTRFVEHATAPKLTGPWTFVGKANWAGWGSGMEGPTVVRLDDGTWRIFLDGQGSVGFLYSDSLDLMSWSKTASLPGLTNVVRHGTVIRDVAIGGGGPSSSGAAGALGSGGMAGAAGASDSGGLMDAGDAGDDAGNADAGGSTDLGGSSGTGVGVTGGGGSLGLIDASGSAGSFNTGGAFGTGGLSGRGASTDASPGPGSGGISPLGQTVSIADSSGCGCGIRPGWSAVDPLSVGCVFGYLSLRLRRRRRPGECRQRVLSGKTLSR